METGKLIGAEALARWVKPDGTIVSPGVFVPCFETSRQICALDEEILTQVCRQMRQMEQEGFKIRPVSVNLSRVHLQQPNLLEKIKSIITEYEINPKNLSFEITESALLEESIPIQTIVEGLHDFGCRVDMDDYGVGASNPNALASTRFDVVKLDRSFIKRIGEERMDDLIQSTIRLTQKWGIEILAEGVEEKEQAERLMELGCTMVQGYYYSRPVPEAAYREMLKRAGDEETEDARGGDS